MKLPSLWPKIETIKAFATYGIAGYIIFRAFNILAELSALSPETFGVAAIGIIGGTVVGVTSFLFGVEQGKQQQKAFEAGVNTTPTGPSTTINATGDTNVEGGDPTLVTTATKTPSSPPKVSVAAASKTKPTAAARGRRSGP